MRLTDGAHGIVNSQSSFVLFPSLRTHPSILLRLIAPMRINREIHPGEQRSIKVPFTVVRSGVVTLSAVSCLLLSGRRLETCSEDKHYELEELPLRRVFSLTV